MSITPRPLSFCLLLVLTSAEVYAGNQCDNTCPDIVTDLDAAFNAARNTTDLPPPGVYYGTEEPTYVPLTEAQTYAIGWFNGCTGTLINYEWVVTAEHCGISRRSEFCFGPDRTRPKDCVDIREVRDHRRRDLTLVRLERDARDIVPDVEPILILTESMSDDWEDRLIEAAGFGNQEDGGYGEREFTAEKIMSVSDGIVRIYGDGERGVCFGDSGGPAMVIDSEGQPRIAGVLSNGDSSCLGYDNYTRLDNVLDWIEGYTGELGTDPVERVEKERVDCPKGFTKYSSNNYAFRDSLCEGELDGETAYVGFTDDQWWVWQETMSNSTMRFSGMDSGEERTFSHLDVAATD